MGELRSGAEGRKSLQDKEQRIRKRKGGKYWIGSGHIANLIWDEKGISMGPRLGLEFKDWLAGYTAVLVRAKDI